MAEEELTRETQLAAGRLKVGVWRPAFGDLSLGLQLQTMSRAAVTNKTSRRQSPFCDECWQLGLTGQRSDVRSSLTLAAGWMACLNEQCSATSKLLVRCVGFLMLLLGTRQTCRRIIVHAWGRSRRRSSRRRTHFAVPFGRARLTCGVPVHPLIGITSG